MTSQETEPKLPAVLEGLLWKRGLAGAHHRDRGTGGSPLVYAFQKFLINPTVELTDPRAGLPQARQLPGGSMTPLTKQIIELKLN